MIAFTSKPEIKLGASVPGVWSQSQIASWITSVLTPWINKRSGLVLIASTEVTSAVASVEFTEGITSEFDAYLIVVADWNSDTDNVECQVRFSEDSGTTWEDDAGDYRHARFGSTDGGAVGAAGSAADTEIQIGAGLGNASGETFSYMGVLTTPSGSAFKKLLGVAALGSTAGAYSLTVVGGHYDGSTNAINGIQFLQSTGNIDGGTFHLFGMRM